MVRVSVRVRVRTPVTDERAQEDGRWRHCYLMIDYHHIWKVRELKKMVDGATAPEICNAERAILVALQVRVIEEEEENNLYPVDHHSSFGVLFSLSFFSFSFPFFFPFFPFSFILLLFLLLFLT